MGRGNFFYDSHEKAHPILQSDFCKGRFQMVESMNAPAILTELSGITGSLTVNTICSH